MRWLFVALALLSALPAHAESRVRSRLLAPKRKSDVAARYRFVGRTDGTWDPSFSRHARPTVTSPATTVDRGDGTAVTVPANTLAVGPAGALVFGARTQALPYSEDLSKWSTISGVTTAWVEGPRGPNSATRLTATTTGGAASVLQSFTATAAQHTCHGWIRAGTVATTDLGINQGASWLGIAAEIVSGPGSVTLSANIAKVTGLTSEWTHLRMTTTSAMTADAALLGVYTQTKSGNFVVAGSSIDTGMWNCTNGTEMYPYTYTESAPLSVAATSVSVPNALQGSEWCIATTANGGAWSGGGTRVLWSLGASSNWVQLFVGTDGKPDFRLYETSPHIFTSSVALSPGQHEFTVCNNAGTVSMLVDGAAQTLTAGGTAILPAQPATAYVGGNSGGANALNGSIRSMTLCNTADPARCR